MKFNITGIYICIMLPLALGYIQKQREDEVGGGFYPLLFLFILMAINLVKADNVWGLIYFYIRGIFL